MRRVASGSRLRVLSRPFSVRSRRHSSGVDRGDPDPVVVDEDIPEYDRFHLFAAQSVCCDPVDLFLLQGCKETLHPRVVKAMSGSA